MKNWEQLIPEVSGKSLYFLIKNKLEKKNRIKKEQKIKTEYAGNLIPFMYVPLMDLGNDVTFSSFCKFIMKKKKF